MKRLIFLQAGKEEIVDIGRPFDLQADRIYVSNWGYKTTLTEEPDWISFRNSTIKDGLIFEFIPQAQDIGTKLTIYIEMGDLNSEDPKKAQYEFIVEVVDLAGKFKVNEIEQNEINGPKKDELLIEVDLPDKEGNLWINFNKPFRIFQNCTKWNSNNEGNKNLKIDFIPSKNTKDFIEEYDITVKMEWKVT